MVTMRSLAFTPEAQAALERYQARVNVVFPSPSVRERGRIGARDPVSHRGRVVRGSGSDHGAPAARGYRATREPASMGSR